MDRQHAPRPSRGSEPHDTRPGKSKLPQGKVQQEVNIYHNGRDGKTRIQLQLCPHKGCPRVSVFMLLHHAIVSLSHCMGERVLCKI